MIENLPTLSTGEMYIMKAIWDVAAISGKKMAASPDVTDYFFGVFRKEFSEKTIYTFHRRLENKGYISRHRKDGILYLEPLVSLDEYLLSVFDEINALWFLGNPEAMAEYAEAYKSYRMGGNYNDY